MKKFALATAAFFLFAVVLLGGLPALQSHALADGNANIAFNDPAFLQALVDNGLDTNKDGQISESEMAAPTSLEISGYGVTDLTGIGYAVNLESLTVSFTSITELPTEVSKLTKLKTLKLYADESMSQSGLPGSLWTLTGLTTLDLEMDNLSSLPAGLADLTTLEELNLYGNGLAVLPSYLGSMKSLQRLYLQQNAIETLPASLCTLANLEELTLWGNKLEALPDGIGGLSSLTDLDLAFNSLTSLPGSMKDLSALRTLELNNNLLTALPTGLFAGMSDLKTLDLYNNCLDPQAGSPDRAVMDQAAGNGASVDCTPQRDYAVTLDYNGGSGLSLPKPRYYYGETVTLPQATLNGRPCLGWDTDGDGVYDHAAGDQVAVAPTKLTASSVAFKAIYGYTVTFRTQRFGTIDGGSADVTQEVTAGERIASVPDVSANPGYEFLGWSDGSALLTGADILAMEVAGDKSFTATFDAVGTLLFPDARFSAALVSAGADGNGDGFITSTEMQALTALDLSGKTFSDMTGIALATSLKELNLSGCGLRAFPAQLESMGGLVSLDLSDNLLTSLPSGCLDGLTHLASLDLSSNYFNPASMPVGTPAFAVAEPQRTYAVALDFAGGSGAALAKSEYCYGEQIDLPLASKEGFAFAGWDGDGDGKPDILGAGADALRPDPPDSLATKTYHAVYLSSDASLKGITLSAGAYLDKPFDAQTASYTVTLYDYVGSVTITPEKSDAGASLLIGGQRKDADTVSLASSAQSADVTVDLTAADGVSARSYALHVVRAASVDLGLTGLSLPSGITLSPGFSGSCLSYTALVPASTASLAVSVTRASSASSVSVGGVACPSCSASVGAAMGVATPVQIVVSAPLNTDKTKTYTLTLERGITVSNFTAAPKVGSTFELSPGGTNRMTFSYAMGGPGTVKIEVYKSSKWVQILSRAEASAGASSWAWDGKVSGAYLKAGTYKVRLTPSAFGMAGAALTISAKIVGSPSVTWRGVVSPFKATGAAHALCSFKVSVPTNAAVNVYNSKGKLVAAVAAFANLLPSSTYTAVAWDGTATSGNAAGLAAGSLVPAGTYTIRISVGAKVYSKTIKVTR